MRQKDIITVITKMIQHEAYTARIFEELQLLDFDTNMMAYHSETASGKAFGGLEILNAITGKSSDSVYDEAVEKASQDIVAANCDIVKLLNLAGFNGEVYYKSVRRYQNDEI